MSLEAAQHLLDEFNDGNWDEVGSYFNDEFDLFLDYLSKYELDHKIAFHEVDEEFKNTILLKNLEINKENTLRFICDDLVTDVSIMDGGYYMYLRSRDELADLFDGGYRGGSPREMAKNVLGEDDFWEPYWDTTDDVYRDVIEDLDESNLGHLASYIIKVIGNQDLNIKNYKSYFFHELAEEQGRGEFFQITPDVVNDLIKNQKAMNELLKGELEDLKSELYSIHNNAYNTAYTDEIYKSVWDEIDTYFDSNSIKSETKERYDGKKVYYEYIKIKNFEEVIKDFLKENLRSTYSDSFLDYFGSYVGLLRYMMENCGYESASFRTPDYPDHNRVEKNINDIFRDYI
jgi:hypothetical protein